MTAAKQPVWDVVALGEALVEFNQTRPGEPQYLQGFGGDTSNAVIAAARAGARTAYLTRLGSDAFGQALLDLWAREGVDTTAVERDAQHPTGIYFVTHGAAGHEFSYLRAGSAASRMAPAWLQDASANGPAAVLQQCHILHVSGISLAVSASACDTAYEAMRVARAAGVKKVVLTHRIPVDDPEITDATWVDGVRQAYDGEVVVGHDLRRVSLGD